MSERQRRTQRLEAWRAELREGRPEVEAPTASEAATDQARRIRRLVFVLGLALVGAWLLRPGELPAPAQPPAPEALSQELGLRDIRVVDDLLHVHASEWESLGSDDRAAAVRAACSRAEQLGFGGVVFYDRQREVAQSCVRRNRSQ
jgi:hypothetical protein